VKFLTCNILNSEFDCLPEYEWAQRRAYCISQIKAQTPDIFGLQECSQMQYADFQEDFPDFGNWGINSGQQGDGPPTEPIFFRREAFTCIDRGGYLLDNETGYIASWIRLRDLHSGKDLHVTNTHLTHFGSEKRRAQLMKILRQTQGDVSQLLMGDLNSIQNGPELQLLLQEGWADTYAAVHGPVRQPGTNHAFCDAIRDPDHAKVDWIFSKGDWKFSDAEVIRERKNGFPASDHYFVSACGSIH